MDDKLRELFDQLAESVAVLDRRMAEVERHIASPPSPPSPERHAVTPGAARTRKWREKKRHAKRHAVTPRDLTYLLPESESLKDKTLRTRARASDVTLPWPRDFREQFWAQYPRKAGKAAALRKLEQIRGKVSWETLMAAVLHYAADPNRDPSFTKHPTTWLNQGCWDDDPLPKRKLPLKERNREILDDLDAFIEHTAANAFGRGREVAAQGHFLLPIGQPAGAQGLPERASPGPREAFERGSDQGARPGDEGEPELPAARARG
jgi:hypothetical protein